MIQKKHIHIILIILCLFLLLSSLSFNAQSLISNDKPWMASGFFSEITTDNHGNYYQDILNNQYPDTHFSSGGLPDLTFVELSSWWGPINTSSVGLFVRYGVINMGWELNQSTPITSNLSFYADGNQTSFGYIIQTPLLYPTHWYPGEILGGCFYFEIDEKPTQISARIDSNQTIEEINEGNNEDTTIVIDGVRVQGIISEKINGQQQLINGLVEISRCDTDTLSTYSYRTFRPDETGTYHLSLYPEQGQQTSYQYLLKAEILADEKKMIRETPPLQPGEHENLDFIFQGSAPKHPSTAIGRFLGTINQTYCFLTQAQDDDAHTFYYKYYWGNEEFSSWLGPYTNNETILMTNKWKQPGSYEIYVIVQDETGLISEWSKVKTITIRERFIPLPPVLQTLRESALSYFIELFF